MRAPISIVIPTLDAASTLPDCLAALMPGLERGLIRELIVSDGGSTDATVAIAKDWGANVLSGPASRGGQLRRGCAQALGDWLLILHADTVLGPEWIKAAQTHMATGQAGWFRLRFDQGGRWVARWANLRSRWFDLPYGDQGVLLPRALYETCGGYLDQPLMEDVALAWALRGKLRPIEAMATTSSERYRRDGWLKRGSRNLWILARYALGADPSALARAYRRKR